ncbi:MSMEG_1061 family FMN-dependent PPOX-type flavoprotein [Kribbella sp. NPDC048915]|uniref:MSMEG_1061 family FMN-dependent PPOX-type flavoprotein n=1 Tax=Kribbella sp. NPDC048915 TaxID=3155148 RepID=UPI0033F9D90D
MQRHRYRRLDAAGIDAAFPPAEEAARNKKRPDVGLVAHRFIAHSPFVVLATVSADGADSSPRGDEPGFVRVLDSRLLAVPDRSGNNLADSFRNVVRDPRVGMLFFVPGLTETLRVNGYGFVTDDPEVLCRFEAGTRPVRLALVVQVEEVFFHCGKAVIRSSLWEPDLDSAYAVAPGTNVFTMDNIERPDQTLSPVEIQRLLAEGYQQDL